MQEIKLSFNIKLEQWIIEDEKGIVRAIFDLSNPDIDHWSDLLPPPEESMQAVFYPDGKKEIKVSAYDQFFPNRMDAMCLSFIERYE